MRMKYETFFFNSSFLVFRFIPFDMSILLSLFLIIGI